MTRAKKKGRTNHNDRTCWFPWNDDARHHHDIIGNNRNEEKFSTRLWILFVPFKNHCVVRGRRQHVERESYISYKFFIFRIESTNFSTNFFHWKFLLFHNLFCISFSFCCPSTLHAENVRWWCVLAYLSHVSMLYTLFRWLLLVLLFLFVVCLCISVAKP